MPPLCGEPLPLCGELLPLYAGNLFQVCVILKDHLRTTLGEGAESGAESDESEHEPGPLQAGGDVAFMRRAWRHVRREVLKMETTGETSAPQDEKVAEAEDSGEQAASTRALRKQVRDVPLARWLEQIPLDMHGDDKILDVLRDEVTALFEMEAMEHPVESSGTWAPDDVEHSKTQEQLIDEFYTELHAKPSEAHGRGSELAAQVDLKHMTPAERASLAKYGAARARGAPIVDPPRAGDTRQLVREDTPYYISLAFLKIFQTGHGDYWAFVQQRRERGLGVNLWDWFLHVVRHRSGRAQRHPRFYYFGINTILRNRAVRGKSYFVRRSYGAQAYEEYTQEALLSMSKVQMTRLLCAYEHKMPGSAAEKLQQRGDLEAMLNQLETESFQRDNEELPAARRDLQSALAAATADWTARRDEGIVSAQESAFDEARAIAEAALNSERAAQSGGSGDQPGAVLREEPPSLGELRALTSRYAKMKRCIDQGGEVPVHFITLTTAIYHWDDLATLLREYEARTTARRGGRSDPLEPGEEKVHGDKRRVLHYIGIVAWYCAVKLELAIEYVLESDDHFGVVEWGAGGIVHLHLLRWLRHRGRYDDQEGEVPAQRRRNDALKLAAGHVDEITEWDIGCPEKFSQKLWDEDVPPRRKADEEPLDTDAASDGSGAEAAPSGGSTDPDEAHWRSFGDDEDWEREEGDGQVTVFFMYLKKTPEAFGAHPPTPPPQLVVFMFLKHAW